jgi:Na+/pantothenate symporter
MLWLRTQLLKFQLKTQEVMFWLNKDFKALKYCLFPCVLFCMYSMFINYVSIACSDFVSLCVYRVSMFLDSIHSIYPFIQQFLPMFLELVHFFVFLHVSQSH